MDPKLSAPTQDHQRHRLKQRRQLRRKAEFAARRNEKQLLKTDEEEEQLLVENPMSKDSRLKLESMSFAFKLKGENAAPEFRGDLMTQVRDLLGLSDVPVQELLRLRIVEFLIFCLRDHHDLANQFEAACALTNIVVGTEAQTRRVVDAGGVQQFVELLYSPRPEVRDQAIWALGSMLSDGPETRIFILSLGTLKRLLALTVDPQALPNHRNVGYWYLNMARCCGAEIPERYVRQLLAGLKQLLLAPAPELSVILDALWSLNYLCEMWVEKKSLSNLELGLAADMPEMLMSLLRNPNEKVQVCALRVLGLLPLPLPQLQSLLAVLPALLSSSEVRLIDQSLWLLERLLTRGSIDVVVEAQPLPLLVRAALQENSDIRRSVLDIIELLLRLCSCAQLRQLWQNGGQSGGGGLVKLLMNRLSENSNELILVSLTIMKHLIMRSYKADIEVKTMLQRAQVMSVLKKLCKHKKMEIKELALATKVAYFTGGKPKK